MKHFATTAAGAGRRELHEVLGLTGAETSINTLEAGTCVPFVHVHQANEEIYGIVGGHGHALIDGECVPVAEGDWIRISPAGKRQFCAAEDSPLSFACIQVKEHSLGGYTAQDAVVF